MQRYSYQIITIGLFLGFMFTFINGCGNSGGNQDTAGSGVSIYVLQDTGTALDGATLQVPGGPCL